MDLKDKTLIITGASSGIGAAAARAAAAEGAHVVLGARRADALEAIARDIRQQGGQAVTHPGDVTDPDYAEALVTTARTEFGALHGAFNNAGMVGDMSPVAEMTGDTWHSVLETNLTSAFFAAKAQIPAMLTGGAIVFTGSFVGVSNGGMPGMAAYAAAKAGLLGLVKSLAIDHAATGHRINAVLPGGTKTAMAGDDPDTHAFIAGLHPVKRMAEPEEIAAAALFLLSDRASFVTGTGVAVDGGMSARFL